MADILACSFCGRGTAEVKRLIQGPGVAICDACVRASYEIIASLDDEPAVDQPAASEAPVPSTPDLVMTAIMKAQHDALSGDRAGAQRQFLEIWERIGGDGDPLHRVTLAHYLADLQDDPHDELAWDERALEAADSLTDERAQEYHATLAVRGFYASLYLNLAADHEKLGDVSAARHNLTLADHASADLPVDGYGDLVRSAIGRLRERIGSGDPNP